MAVTTTLYQGDSSDIVAVAVYSAGVQVTDLTGYSGKFSIVKALGDVAEVTKDMVVVGDEFRSQLTPAESNAIDPGIYIGVVEIKNDTLEFKKEHHITVTINKQGYTP